MSTSAKRAAAGLAACAVGFMVVALLAFEAPGIEDLDARMLGRFASLSDSGVGSFAEVVRSVGNPLPYLVLVGLVCAIAVIRQRPRDLGAAMVALVGANLTTQLVKTLVPHSRFHHSLGWDQPGSGSFPSGHMTAATALVITLAMVVPRQHRNAALGVGGAFLAAMALSLVVLEAHYPSDVIGGFLVACGWGCAAVLGRELLTEAGMPRRDSLTEPPVD